MNIAAISPPLTERPAWKALKTHYQQIREVHLRQLFADDPQRGKHLSAEALGLYLDYSKNRITGETRNLLLQLAEESGLRARYGQSVPRLEQRVKPDGYLQGPGLPVC